MFDFIFGDPVTRLVNARTKHLSVFSRLVAKLDAVHLKMQEEVQRAVTNIQRKEEEISEIQEKIKSHNNVIDLLEKEKVNTLKTKEKISSLMGDV